jgi:hypothetical protein
VITVTLEEHEARALVFSSDMGDMLIEKLTGRPSPFAPGESPREIAVLKLIAALERGERPSHFEALGVSGFERRTWDPREAA